jgi:hypothetical protein
MNVLHDHAPENQARRQKPCRLCDVKGALATHLITIRGMVDVPNVPACDRCTRKYLTEYPRSTAVPIVVAE